MFNTVALLIFCLSTAASMKLLVKGAGSTIVNGMYLAKAPTIIPDGFSKTCDKMGWDSSSTWRSLSNQVSPWWKHSENESYIYYNKGDRQWWIDGPSGAGLYVVMTAPGEINTSNMETAHPPVGGWELLSSAKSPAPSVDMIAAGDALE